MKKCIVLIVFILSSNAYGASLTPNTLPYTCQGGTSPQLCDSNLKISGSNVGIGSSNPSQTLDVQGVVRAVSYTGVNGGLFGSWSSPLSNGTVYQATTDGFLMAYWSGSSHGSYTFINCYTDSNPSPATIRSSNDINMGQYIGYQVVNCMTPVRKNDYYKYQGGGDQASQSGTGYFLPLGS